MPVYKVDLIMEGEGRGWRETYYRNWTGDIGSVFPVVQTLATKRAELNGAPVQIKAYSVQDPLTPGRQGQSFYFNPRLESGFGQGSDGAAAPATSINIVMVNNLNSRTRRTQMRGAWDNAITFFGRLDTAEFAQWNSKFLQLRTYMLQQNFGWIMRPRAARDVHVAYEYVGASLVPRFTFTADFFPAEQVNTYQSVRFSGFNSKKSPLNRELIVWIEDRNHAVASEPIAAAPMTGHGKCIRYGTPEFIGIDNMGVERVGRRAPGAPLLATPGRARARARS